MEAPLRIEPTGLNDYLEVMSKSVFQSGISWKVVKSKWPDIKEAFQGFDVDTVSDLTEADIDELTQDKRVIRNRRKLEAIVTNARRMAELDDEHGGFQNYLRSHQNFDALTKDIKKQFKFMGDTGIYHFMWVVSEEVPPHDEWFAARQKK